jgi:hypothetical protein
VIFRKCCGRAASGYDYGNSPRHEIIGQSAKSIIVVLCPAIFDENVLPLNEVTLPQALAKCGEPICVAHRRSAAKPTDHRQRAVAHVPRLAKYPQHRREA